MKIAIWKTGHQIADTVADELAIGFDAKIRNVNEGNLCDENVDIGYGILRGMGELFRQDDICGDDWFNIDRGYFNPGHFDGYYRISYKGTQAKWHEGIPQSDECVELEDWEGGGGKIILVCPPTEAVCGFFNIEIDRWLASIRKLYRPICLGSYLNGWRVRSKDDDKPIDWNEVGVVITFNSSVGWQALQRGIPCISDTEHSIVGSYYKYELDKLGLDYSFENVMKIPREPLFKSMLAHQFTLNELRAGKAWDLINHYLKKS